MNKEEDEDRGDKTEVDPDKDDEEQEEAEEEDNKKMLHMPQRQIREHDKVQQREMSVWVVARGLLEDYREADQAMVLRRVFRKQEMKLEE